ncbi:MAG: ParB/RepB/Spo0J family partition protein [Gemmatimonadales bacterium]
MAKGETRLGKGLGALLGENLDAVEDLSGPVTEIPVARIEPNPYQPRSAILTRPLRDLVESIRENGLLQPLVVRPSGTGWHVVAGERRFRAVSELGWDHVPVIIRDLSDEQMLVLALVENLQREDLSPIEEAVGYQQLIDLFGLTQQQVADRVGRERSTVANALRLLALPSEVKEMVAAGQLSAGHARAILVLQETDAQIAFAREIVANKLSVREAEAHVRQERDTEKPSRHRRRASQADDPVVRRAQTVLERALGTEVRVRRTRANKGELRIRYHGTEDFERLVRLLAGEAADELFEQG